MTAHEFEKELKELRLAAQRVLDTVGSRVVGESLSALSDYHKRLDPDLVLWLLDNLKEIS